MTRGKSAFVRCSPELAKRVKDEAEARDLGERFLVDRALTDLLDNLIPVAEFSLTRKRVLPNPDEPFKVGPVQPTQPWKTV